MFQDCNKEDITFASVHDSFWTHAATVTDMNKIIRNTFITLHENNGKNVLIELDEAFKARYQAQAKDMPELPKFGELDLKEVRNSLYFFD